MYRYRWMLSLLLLAVLILSGCQPVMPVEADTSAETESVNSEAETTTPTWDEIFVIDKFAYKREGQFQEYTCHIGVDCGEVDIPAGLCGKDDGIGCDSYDIPKLTLVFELSSDYNELVLHLRRAGSETTAVSVDGGEPLLVTSEMLGSRDGGVNGSYELALGPLQSGSHFIAFTVHDDGTGNSMYNWSELSLTAR
jgi:hypothetical protein